MLAHVRQHQHLGHDLIIQVILDTCSWASRDSAIMLTRSDQHQHQNPSLRHLSYAWYMQLGEQGLGHHAGSL